MHDWLVRFVLKVALPATRAEVWCRPALHPFEFFLSWTGFDTGLNAVGRQWTCAIECPLSEDLLLCLLVTSNKVIKGLGFRLSSVSGESQIVVLEVLTDTR